MAGVAVDTQELYEPYDPSGPTRPTRPYWVLRATSGDTFVARHAGT